MNNELLDPQSEVQSLAVVTAEELPGYAEWCAECEAKEDPNWLSDMALRYAESLGEY